MRHDASLRPTPRRILLLTVAVLAGGCGTTIHSPSLSPARPAVLTTWPSVADYTTIKTAVAARDDALFHERDWHRMAFAALLGARTLLTVRIAPGRCATYVAELYGNLRDLMDAYRGEDWRPLVRLVRREPALAEVCLQPKVHLDA